jgi:hypothetical protein
MNLPSFMQPYLIILPIVIGFLPFLGWSKNQNLILKRLLALMPIFWTAIGFWGGFFKYDQHQHNSSGLTYVVYLIVIGFVIYSRHCLKNSQENKSMVIFIIFVNSYFILSISLCALMAISGSWL